MIDLVIKNIEKKIEFEKQFTVYNRRRIFRRARVIMVIHYMSYSDALKQAWAESKAVVIKCRFELKCLNNQLIGLFTPVQYHQTEKYKVEQMIKASNNGFEL